MAHLFFLMQNKVTHSCAELTDSRNDPRPMPLVG